MISIGLALFAISVPVRPYSAWVNSNCTRHPLGHTPVFCQVHADCDNTQANLERKTTKGCSCYNGTCRILGNGEKPKYQFCAYRGCGEDQERAGKSVRRKRCPGVASHDEPPEAEIEKITLRRHERMAEAQKWLDETETILEPAIADNNRAMFAWVTNITNETEKTQNDKRQYFMNIYANATEEAYEKFDVSEISDPVLKRLMRRVQSGMVGSTPVERQENNEIQTALTTRYNFAKICPPSGPETCNDTDKLPLSPDLSDIMKNSRNETELLIVWKRWRDVAGKASRDDFFKLAHRLGEQDQRIGIESLTKRWLQSYEDDAPDFRDQLRDLFHQIVPLYENLHAYVRFKLNKHYGDEVVPPNGTLPAHILGEMWAKQWSNIYDLVEPYPNETYSGAESKKPSLTEAMVAHNWTAVKIFRVAEDFFKSVGMPSLRPTFWENSMFVRPNDGRNVMCHPLASDVDYRDARIKMCAQVTEKDFGTVHHEMGHVYYYMAYENQSMYYRDGANPGFHEAVGDMLLISSTQDVYFKHLGILDQDYAPTDKARINELLKKALDMIMFVPYGYIMDLWRWSIFDKTVTKDQANEYYWNLRKNFQGLHAPVERQTDDCDPVAMFHIANFVPYIRYLVARFLQYDFHEALCTGTEPGQDTSSCSIFNNTDAGDKLWKMLKMGCSRPWPEALSAVTGRTKMSARPILKFFSKLVTWLRRENARNGVCIGWGNKWPEEVEVNEPRC